MNQISKCHARCEENRLPKRAAKALSMRQSAFRSRSMKLRTPMLRCQQHLAFTYHKVLLQGGFLSKCLLI